MLDRPVLEHGIPYFPFHFASHTINRAIASFRSKFYRFEIAHAQSRLRVHLAETPPTTLFLLLFDANRQLIHRSQGAAGERFEKTLTRGHYFLQSTTTGTVTDGATRCVGQPPHCLNVGALSIEAFPLPAATDASDDAGRPHDLGHLDDGRAIHHRETLLAIHRRGPAPTDPGLRRPLAERELDDSLDYFGITLPAPGQLYGGISPVTLSFEVKTDVGWARLSQQNGVALAAGRHLVRVTNAPVSGTIVIGAQGDFWLEYTMTLRFQARR